jgi:uncharacterized protein (DUF2147 family)
MVLAQILGELICSGIFSLFAAPLLPNKKNKVELNNNNLDMTNKEENFELADKGTEIQWWDGEISKPESKKYYKKRCKYYFDILENGKKRKKRCGNYHENEKYCDEHSEK